MDAKDDKYTSLLKEQIATLKKVIFHAQKRKGTNR